MADGAAFDKMLAEYARSPGGGLLDEVRDFFADHIILPNAFALDAVVLWCAHTHGMGSWATTPRLAFVSPMPGSGKSRALECLALLVAEPIHAANASVAFIARRIGSGEVPPTLLLDEIDVIFRGVTPQSEDLRGIVNAGHRRGVSYCRMEGEGRRMKPVELATFSAVAMAGLGRRTLPDTIRTRSIIVSMRKRAPGETVRPLRPHLIERVTEGLRDRLATWMGNSFNGPLSDFPDLPEGIEDRLADVWEPLLAVADAAGGDWPERARKAAKHFAAVVDDDDNLALMLLEDMRAVFKERAQVATSDILSALIAMPERPWSDLRGKPITARWLGAKLKDFEISSANYKEPRSNSVRKVYQRAQLDDVWARYLPPSREVAATTATAATELNIKGDNGSGSKVGSATEPPGSGSSANDFARATEIQERTHGSSGSSGKNGKNPKGATKADAEPPPEAFGNSAAIDADTQWDNLAYGDDPDIKDRAANLAAANDEPRPIADDWWPAPLGPYATSAAERLAGLTDREFDDAVKRFIADQRHRQNVAANFDSHWINWTLRNVAKPSATAGGGGHERSA